MRIADSSHVALFLSSALKEKYGSVAGGNNSIVIVGTSQRLNDSPERSVLLLNRSSRKARYKDEMKIPEATFSSYFQRQPVRSELDAWRKLHVIRE